ncbi:Gfo/Idh/MocA family oxidoreductase [Streptacidiphilus sp. PB12-B1b]|uniref:Gfo/Idh/MocA family protein n=1 Tax=Streptacidiphilus sp. PB12-B1b TaxID=2705012 RepID=UPI0015F9821B|nr:Gfo/Idh/MocA family oxidoreductase [Streptacidiphilus sp. PB12-B1b]QMU76890.1 Gfo/Idh/MocA family oxidoreductase [Streptacidiphilus sp. PB12-B1b]
MRFGLFGTGHWAARTHAAAIDAHPGSMLAGVWGRDRAKTEALAQRYGAPAFHDVDELIEAVDAVAVALPPDIQAGIAARAASAGRHLLLDKPLALSLADADRVVVAAEATGIASVVFFTFRFRPEVDAFLASATATGGWHGVRATFFASIFGGQSPYGGSQWRREQGALWDVGPHLLSLVLPILGPVTEVAAVDGPRGTVHVLLKHADGAAGTLSLTLDAPPEATGFEMVLHGESGFAELPQSGGDAVAAFLTALDRLHEEVRTGTRGGGCDVRFARDVTAVLEAVGTARAEARTVRVVS